ncbi:MULTISPECIES: ABC transporter ATP-binding protein [unclassified Roseitalea]|uniref:ABC transporter ATP-binding protein n=1 Tax=unclassified Roseitalea TaxID=2639107 RepID=UPI00273E22C8|nr:MULTISPECIES: ABC transporter ATP-binding protein [unclassified Roseitalea]
MTETILKVDNVSKAFGALRACDRVSLDLRLGEIHALIGPNGAGKSTLIKQIAGNLRPDSGRIEFLGRDVAALDTVERARMGLGRSFQISAVIAEFTVLQNVVLAVQGARGTSFHFLRGALSDRAVTEAARLQIERAHLGGREAVRASDLAHGERRRLELAMALALRPKAFLLDEPMAGMGADGVAEMTGLLDGLRHEAPILLVEHDMDAVFALADRISVLDYGQIIASGTVDEIRAHPEVRRAYLGEEDAA